MALLNRVRMVWTGLNGLPGVSVFYVREPLDTTFLTNLRLAAVELADILPSGLTLTIENQGDTIEDTTGTLSGSWSGAVVAPVLGLVGAAGHAAGTGCRVSWLTGGIVDGRRVQGRTFIAPIASVAYQADGTIVEVYRQFVDDFADVVLADGRFAIWSRPRPADPVNGVAARAGSSHLITSVSVPDEVASLRSRRR